MVKGDADGLVDVIVDGVVFGVGFKAALGEHEVHHVVVFGGDGGDAA
jgi:hypothetical protein